MTSFFETPNGIPMYLVGKLSNDFSTIFCQVFDDSINFIGARDHLAVHLKIFNNRDINFFREKGTSLNLTYAFDSNDVKGNIDWFRTKANSNRKERLSIEPHESQLHIFNKVVDAKLDSVIKESPIPTIPKMDGGLFVKLLDLKEMVSQIKSIKEGVLKLTLSNSTMKMSGSMNNVLFYKIRIHQNKSNVGNDVEKSTLCLKDMLLISCQLAAEIQSQSVDLRFYPGGATQIFSQGHNVSIRCLITAVKE